MNFSKRKSKFSILSVFATAFCVCIDDCGIAQIDQLDRARGRRGLEVEVPFEIRR